MVCKGCKYFLNENIGFCGLGKDCSSVTECLDKVEGCVEFNIENCGIFSFIYPNKGVEQAPSKLSEITFSHSVWYFKRTHTRVNKLREVKIEFVYITKFPIKSCMLLKEHIRGIFVKDRDINCFTFHYEKDNNEIKVTVSWFENIRESYLAKQKAKRRQTIRTTWERENPCALARG